MADKTPAGDQPPEKKVWERIERGKAHIRDNAPRRNECLAFWRGEQYVNRVDDGYLVSQSTILPERPSHRPRTVRNLIHGLVEAKVSAATQRVPSYEVSPATNDAEDVSAARLSEKVAVFGYDKWSVRRHTVKVATNAIVQDGGYAMPIWDATVPPYISADGLGMGEVKILTFSGNEVGWEPGLDFYESPWHMIQQARLIDDVEAMPGFIKGKERLSPDAQSHEVLNTGNKSQVSKLVMVSEYLERPCAKYPQGRRIVVANDRVILPEEPYPGADYGYDGCAIHALSYTIDPEMDRDRGLVCHLLDAQRTYNNATNQQISWAQLALNPQIIGPPMANGKVKFTDEPGAYYEVIPINGMTPQWRDVPPIPPELSAMKEEAKRDMQEMAAANDIPTQVESGKAIQAVIEKDQIRWQAFIAEIAEFHSSLMRHCLTLVQQYYAEPRLLKIKGRFGPELIQDFMGADLRNQVDIRVSPASIEPRTKAYIEQRILAYADRGWITPEAAMSAISGGTAEKLIESYELDVSRAHQILQKIKAGPEVLFGEPMVDPMQPPSWAPRKFDNIAVHKNIFEDFMKTQEYDSLEPGIQEACRLYYDACEYLEAIKLQQQIMAQNAMAEQQGMDNAAKPQGAKPSPDQRNPENDAVPAP
jgi:hypothetical protein